ncbi:exonuclease domain-containing protein [Deinococcus altitudinis]|uniref:exonuclease domain-containing protein n=1 Tax=Deinococcus altitudinis TaxID=468914 RepID=UPI00389201A4
MSLSRHHDQPPVNVVDLEATCWNGPVPPGQSNEVIEIGLCVFDPASRERRSRHQIVVKPDHSEISEFCTRLTGWTAAQVACGASFAEACGQLRREFRADARLMVSWGGYDYRQIRRQCELTDTPFPFRRHLDLKAAHREFYGLPKRLGLGQALDHAGMAFEGRAHVGADDAWNVAALLAQMLEQGFGLPISPTDPSR